MRIVTAGLVLLLVSCSTEDPVMTTSDLQIDFGQALDFGGDRIQADDGRDDDAGVDNPAPSDHDPVDQDPVDPGPGCENGLQDCDADNLVQCIDGAWSIVEPACAEGCTAGVCNVCRPGTKRCDDVFVSVCLANGTGWQRLDACPCGGRCESGACTDGCEIRECGDNGCGVNCGYCSWGWICSDGECVEQ